VSLRIGTVSTAKVVIREHLCWGSTILIVISDCVYPVADLFLYGFRVKGPDPCVLERPCFKGKRNGGGPGPGVTRISENRHCPRSGCYGFTVLGIPNSSRDFGLYLLCWRSSFIWPRVRGPEPCILGYPRFKGTRNRGPARPGSNPFLGRGVEYRVSKNQLCPPKQLSL